MNIVFFDSDCVACVNSIRFLIFLDKKKVLRYSSLKSDIARKFIPFDKIKNLNSVIYYNDGLLYEKSDALIKIFLTLGGIYKVVYVASFIPTFLRDFIYDIIAFINQKIVKKFIKPKCDLKSDRKISELIL